MLKTIILNLERLKLPNKRKCPNCKKFNKPNEALKVNISYFCNIDCATKHAYKNRDKGKAIKHREQKKEFKRNDLKTRKDAAKKACHTYIRARDKGQPCICCGRPLGEKYDAGHFLESGNNSRIRYDEDNIHAQSVYCNQYKGGNSDDYRGNLIKKIGLQRVERLESMKGGAVKRTAEDYIEIEEYYKQKLKELNDESI